MVGSDNCQESQHHIINRSTVILRPLQLYSALQNVDSTKGLFSLLLPTNLLMKYQWVSNVTYETLVTQFVFVCTAGVACLRGPQCQDKLIRIVRLLLTSFFGKMKHSNELKLR